MINRKTFRDFDWVIFVTVCVLLVLGLLTVYSTTYSQATSSHPTRSSGETQIFLRQVMWIAVGIMIASIFYLTKLRFWNGVSWIFYLISIVGLILVILVGRVVHGAKRWIDFGPMRIQPSEFAKLGTLLLLASFLSNKKFQVMRLRNLTIPILIVAIPFLFVLIEPDVGTSAIFLILGILMLFYKGTPLIYLFIVVSPIIALICGAHWVALLIYLTVVGAVFYFTRLPLNDFIPSFLVNLVAGLLHPVFWSHLKPYQRARITGFLFPSQDPQGSGWQILQSKIAIGSGGLWGKGILKGTQKGFDFLPEVHTDFVFAAIGEELGFLGGLMLLVCFFIFLWRGIKIAKTSRSDFNSFLAIGIVGILGTQVFINIGMAIGIIPVIGVPLPFISYGGSSMVLCLALVGLLLNIAKHKYEY